MGKITDIFDGIKTLGMLPAEFYAKIEQSVGTKAIIATLLVGGWVYCTATGRGVSPEFGSFAMTGAGMYLTYSSMKNAPQAIKK